MGENVQVRAATPDDASGIAYVHAASWQGAYAHVFPADALHGLDEQLARRTEQWAERLRDLDARWHTLVAISEDEVVGFVSGGPSSDEDADAIRVGELSAIYVLPSAWGTGAGRRLMTEFVKGLRESGFEAATLWVLDDNPRARRFYEAAGWTLDGESKDDVLLETPVREVRYRIELG